MSLTDKEHIKKLICLEENLEKLRIDRKQGGSLLDIKIKLNRIKKTLEDLSLELNPKIKDVWQELMDDEIQQEIELSNDWKKITIEQINTEIDKFNKGKLTYLSLDVYSDKIRSEAEQVLTDEDRKEFFQDPNYIKLQEELVLPF